MEIVEETNHRKLLKIADKTGITIMITINVLHVNLLRETIVDKLKSKIFAFQKVGLSIIQALA